LRELINGARNKRLRQALPTMNAGPPPEAAYVRKSRDTGA